MSNYIMGTVVHVPNLRSFQIEAADVGKIFKIRIGHDGTGMGSGWYLEKVDIKRLVMGMAPKEKKEDKKKKKKKKKGEEDEEDDDAMELQEIVQTYSFPCDRWLARDEEDGEIVVELLPEDAEDLEGIPPKIFNIKHEIQETEAQLQLVEPLIIISPYIHQGET